MGSFQKWVDIEGGMLEVAGIEGFLGNQRNFTEKVNDEESEWEVFLRALQRRFHDQSFAVTHVVCGGRSKSAARGGAE